MEIIVLGSSAAYPGPGGACSGYLVKDHDKSVLLDCGTGVLSNLLMWVDPMALTSLVVTHMHTDHFLDLYPLRYYLVYEAHERPLRPRLYIPAGGVEVISSLYPDRVEAWLEAFDIRDLREGSDTVDGIELRFSPVSHGRVEAFAIRVTGEKVVTYLSDCRFGEDLVDIAQGSDVLIAEATLQNDQVDSSLFHLSAEDAGRIASSAGVKTLLLTHFWPSLDRAKSVDEARSAFDGQIWTAAENMSYTF